VPFDNVKDEAAATAEWNTISVRFSDNVSIFESPLACVNGAIFPIFEDDVVESSFVKAR